MSDTETRTPTAVMADNLLSLAGMLAAHPDLPVPPYVTTSGDGRVRGDWFLHIDYEGLSEQRDAAARILRTLRGHWDKAVAHDGDRTYRQKRGGLTLVITVAREAVCKRVVTGAHEVTIPAVEAQPARIEVVEDVEWVCDEPLLAEAVSA